MNSLHVRPRAWVLGNHAAARLLITGMLVVSLPGCAPDSPNDSGEDHVTGPSGISPSMLLGASPRSRADSVLAVRRLARSLALALDDSRVRADFLQAFRGSRVTEGKLQIQRFTKKNGASLARRLEQLNRVPSGDLDRALASVEDLEVYLPNPLDRKNWKGTSDVLVAGFIETDTELRQRGTVIAYDTRGNETTVSYTKPGSRPVIVLTNVESQYGSDGEGPLFSAAGTETSNLTPNMKCLDCVPPPPPPPLPPPPPPNPCPSSLTGTNVYVCRSYIRNVDSYEGFLRGEPEVAMLMFAELPSGTGMGQIGCINEDQTGARHYDQNTDNGAGKALIGSKAAIDQAHAAGKAVLMLVWEDDQGSKCSFQTSNSTKRKIFQFLDLAGTAVSIGWGTCAATEACSKGPPPWLFWIGVSVAAISEIILGNDDDLIGAVALPAGANPYTSPAPILSRESSTSGVVNRGAITFMTQP